MAETESGTEGEASFTEEAQTDTSTADTRTFEITAYCSCQKCCGKSDGITASGAKAVEGVTIAADTNILPFGTKVKIDEKVYTVQDRGGAIKGNRIDVYFESHEKALEYGRQMKEVIILESGDKKWNRTQ